MLGRIPPSWYASDMSSVRWVSLLAVLLLTAGCTRTGAPAPADVAGVRVVSLAPSLTEIVAGVGGADRLVGRTDVCNYPPAVVRHVPIVGAFGRPFLEAVAAQKPTVLLDVGLEDETQAASLASLRIARRHIPCQHLDDVPAAIRAVGGIVARQHAADALAQKIATVIRERRATLAQTPAAKRPLVFAVIWSDPLIVAGRNSFVSELVTLAGGRNLGDDLPRDYAEVSMEWVLERNPDIVLCLFHDASQHARQAVMARAGWQTLRAVQTGQVYDAFDLDTILRPGPRVLDGLNQMQRAIEKGHRL